MMSDRYIHLEQRRAPLRRSPRDLRMRDARPAKADLARLRTMRMTPRSRAIAGAGDGIIRPMRKVRLGAHFPAPPSVTFGTGETASQRTRPCSTNGVCAALRSTAHRSFRAQAVAGLS
jgi:hypothetical protein